MKKSERPLTKIALLLRCIIGSCLFTALWVGIVLMDKPHGIAILIASAILLILFIFKSIIKPLSRL